MKFYVELDTTALCMLYNECKANKRDVTITMAHSEKYGDYAIVSTYKTDLKVLSLALKVGLKEKRKEH